MSVVRKRIDDRVKEMREPGLMRHLRGQVEGWGHVLGLPTPTSEDVETLKQLALESKRLGSMMVGLAKQAKTDKGTFFEDIVNNVPPATQELLDFATKGGKALADFKQNVDALKNDLAGPAAMIVEGLKGPEQQFKDRLRELEQMFKLKLLTDAQFDMARNNLQVQHEQDMKGPVAMPDRERASRIFGGSFLTEGGRSENTAFQSRGLNSRPFDESKTQLKTLSEILAELKRKKDWEDRMLRAVEDDPGTAQQILEIRNGN
jgi:hypothetical protein